MDGNAINDAPFNMNSGLVGNAPTQPWTSRYLPQTDAHLKMAKCLKSARQISSAWCMRRAGSLSSPPPNRVKTSPNLLPFFFLSGHLKFIKCGSMITFTRAAFDLLSLNYHKAVQEQNDPPPPLCRSNCILNFLGGRWGALIQLLGPDITEVILLSREGGALMRNNGRDAAAARRPYVGIYTLNNLS